MFVSVSDSLPKTSYIKMVDVWLITSLLIPFFEVFKQNKFTNLNDAHNYYLRFCSKLLLTFTGLMKAEQLIIMGESGQ